MEKLEVLLNDTINCKEELSKVVLTPEQTQQVNFKFEHTDESKFLQDLVEVLDFEEDNFNYATDTELASQTLLGSVDIKSISSDLKIKAFKLFLTRETIVDTSVILNIYNFIKTYNMFEDSFFAHPNIYFNSLEEYLDIRYALTDDLNTFSRTLTCYFLSCLYSLHITDADTEYSRLVSIPNIYQRILGITDLFTLSRLMGKHKDLTLQDLVGVQNSTKYIQNLCIQEMASLEFFKYLEGKENNDI